MGERRTVERIWLISKSFRFKEFSLRTPPWDMCARRLFVKPKLLGSVPFAKSRIENVFVPRERKSERF